MSQSSRKGSIPFMWEEVVEAVLKMAEVSRSYGLRGHSVPGLLISVLYKLFACKEKVSREVMLYISTA